MPSKEEMTPAEQVLEKVLEKIVKFKVGIILILYLYVSSLGLIYDYAYYQLGYGIHVVHYVNWEDLVFSILKNSSLSFIIFLLLSSFLLIIYIFYKILNFLLAKKTEYFPVFQEFLESVKEKYSFSFREFLESVKEKYSFSFREFLESVRKKNPFEFINLESIDNQKLIESIQNKYAGLPEQLQFHKTAYEQNIQSRLRNEQNSSEPRKSYIYAYKNVIKVLHFFLIVAEFILAASESPLLVFAQIFGFLLQAYALIFSLFLSAYVWVSTLTLLISVSIFALIRSVSTPIFRVALSVFGKVCIVAVAFFVILIGVEVTFLTAQAEFQKPPVNAGMVCVKRPEACIDQPLFNIGSLGNFLVFCKGRVQSKGATGSIGKTQASSKPCKSNENEINPKWPTLIDHVVHELRQFTFVWIPSLIKFNEIKKLILSTTNQEPWGLKDNVLIIPYDNVSCIHSGDLTKKTCKDSPITHGMLFEQGEMLERSIRDGHHRILDSIDIHDLHVGDLHLSHEKNRKTSHSDTIEVINGHDSSIRNVLEGTRKEVLLNRQEIRRGFADSPPIKHLYHFGCFPLGVDKFSCEWDQENLHNMKETIGKVHEEINRCGHEQGQDKRPQVLIKGFASPEPYKVMSDQRNCALANRRMLEVARFLWKKDGYREEDFDRHLKGFDPDSCGPENKSQLSLPLKNYDLIMKPWSKYDQLKSEMVADSSGMKLNSVNRGVRVEVNHLGKCHIGYASG